MSLQMNRWRHLPYEVHTGAENMAIDEAILQAMADKTQSMPTLRFYGWQPAALSLGYAQSYAKEVNEEALKLAGLDVVRRSTGGRAVLHQYELTYSVIAPVADEHVAGSVVESYLKISQALLAGFQAVGIPAQMAEGGLGQGSSAACFDSPSWYELVVDGRKLVGSAQVRKDGVLLQHGSIVFHFDVPLLFSLLKFPSEQLRNRLLKAFTNKACGLDEVWSRPVNMGELEQAICEGFRRIMQIILAEEQLTVGEQELAKKLVLKYRSNDWTKRR